MDTKKFTTAFIEARGGVEELSEDEKQALVSLNEGLSRSSGQMKATTILAAILKKTNTQHLAKATNGMDPKEVGEVFFDALVEVSRPTRPVVSLRR